MYRGGRGWTKQKARQTTEAIAGAVTGSLRAPTTALLGHYNTGGRLRYTGRTTPLGAVVRHALADHLRAGNEDSVRVLSATASGVPFQGITPQVAREVMLTGHEVVPSTRVISGGHRADLNRLVSRAADLLRVAHDLGGLVTPLGRSERLLQA